MEDVDDEANGPQISAEDENYFVTRYLKITPNMRNLWLSIGDKCLGKYTVVKVPYVTGPYY